MTQQQAKQYLSETVAEYVENGFPLTYLTGEEGGGRPDKVNVWKLRKALMALGFEKAMDKLPNEKD